MAKATEKPATVCLEFTGVAQLRGKGFFPGNRADVDEATAAAYVRAGQGRILTPAQLNAELNPPPTDSDDKKQTRPTANRGRKKVETASGEAGETR